MCVCALVCAVCAVCVVCAVSLDIPLRFNRRLQLEGNIPQAEFAELHLIWTVI